MDYNREPAKKLALGKIGRNAWEFTKKLSGKTGKFFRDSALLARPLSKKEKFKLFKTKQYLISEEEQKLTSLLKQGKAEIKLKRYGWSFLISGKDLLPRVFFVKPEKRKFNPDLGIEVSQQLWLEELDKKIRRRFYERNFREFSQMVWTSSQQFIAPNIMGNLEAKQALVLQLFCKEPAHILLLGSQGVGKTSMLASVAELSPISSFGWGSGSSRVGLAVTVHGKKVLPGLLPKAHGGICCIDDLNVMKKEDYFALCGTMERGFVTCNRGKHQYRFDALIKVLAAMNLGSEAADLKPDVPFEPAFLARFHLILVIKKTALSEFAAIAEKIISEDKIKVRLADVLFLKKYIKFANNLDVEVPPQMADKIKEFATALKVKESELLFEVTSQTVAGITRLAKASARMELRPIVEGKDLERIFNIVSKAYGVVR